MIERILKDHRHIIVGGSGGVGKTSVSAALGIAAARSGYRTLVLTIDPARRLAGALGLKEFPEEAMEISELLREKGEELSGTLSVMMLKVEDAFRPLIEKVIGDPALKNRIYTNLLYREITRSLSATPEYAALRRFAEVSLDYRYERLILDTPPTTHALYFLNSPERLRRFFQSGWVRILASLGGSAGFRLVRRSSNLLLSVMERLTGSQLLRTMGDFLALTQELFSPLEDEVARSEAILTDPQTVFLVVTAPLPDELEETKRFLHSLESLRIHVGGVIVNQLLPPLRTSLLCSKDIQPRPNSKEKARSFELRFLRWLQLLKERTEKEAPLCYEFLRSGKVELILVKKQPEDIHTLTGLLELEKALLNPFKLEDSV